MLMDLNVPKELDDISLKTRKLRYVLLFSGALFFAIIGYLMFEYYHNVSRLRKLRVQNFHEEIEEMGGEIGYYIAGGIFRIASISSDRDIHVYFSFSNNALGMSAQYGLKSSRDAVQNRLSRMMTATFSGEHVFQRIVLFDSADNLVAESRLPEVSEKPMEIIDSLKASYTEPQVILKGNQRGFPEILRISVPVRDNNIYRGRVVAEARFKEIALKMASPTLKRLKPDFAIVQKNISTGKGNETAGLLDRMNGFDELPDMNMNTAWAREIKTDKRHSLVANTPISGSQFSLLTEAPLPTIHHDLHRPFIDFFLWSLVLTLIPLLVFLYHSLIRSARLKSSHSHIVLQKNETNLHNKLLAKEIFERKETEQALRESEQRLERALDGAEMGMWDWNVVTDNRIHSEEWMHSMGYSPGEVEMTLQAYRKLVHPEDLRIIKKAHNAYFRGEEPIYEAEYRLKTKSGTWKWIQARGKAIERDRSGRPIRMVGTHLNITDRKKAEEKIKKYQTELETLVELRTRQLRNAQKELINRAFESGFNQMAAMVLHNIGNGITPIPFYIEQLRQDTFERVLEYLKLSWSDLTAHRLDLTDYINKNPNGRERFDFMKELIEGLHHVRNQQIEKISKIDQSVLHVREIIKMHQFYSRPHSNTNENTDINSVITDAMSMQSGAINKRGIAIETHLAKDLPKLLINKNRLLQVFINLLKNAYEAIDQLGPNAENKRIRITTGLKEGSIEIQVSDTGIGMKPERIPKYMDKSISGKGSTGFGLRYCKMFMEQNNGELSMLSDGSGRGANVTLKFYLSSDANLPAPVASTGKTVEQTAGEAAQRLPVNERSEPKDPRVRNMGATDAAVIF